MFRFHLLSEIGVYSILLDQGEIKGQLSGITKALEVVGTKTFRDTLHCVEMGGIVCNTGILGGQYILDDFDPIKEIPNGVYLTGFYSNNPTRESIDDLMEFVHHHSIFPHIGRVYDFSEIAQACDALDSGNVDGKIVVSVVVARIDFLSTSFYIKGYETLSLINISKLTFTYPGIYDKIIENISFKIDTSWKFGFIGRNGRGKTGFLIF